MIYFEATLYKPFLAILVLLAKKVMLKALEWQEGAKTDVTWLSQSEKEGEEMSIDSMIDKISENIPQSDKEYLGEDGLLHCAVCHKKTQTEIKNPFTGQVRKVPCICACKEAELEARKERTRPEDLERQRRICFAETNMSGWTFANDDRRNEKISDAMQRYVDGFPDFRREGKGLLLYGSVGTGKTYYAACIANALIEQEYTVHMTNFARLTNTIQGMFDGKQRYLDSLNRYSMLILDDLGAERSSEYMQEMVFNIFDGRYRSGLPFIVTTNLTAEQIKQPQDIGHSRIYDRILERCFPVEIKGGSRRRENIRNSYFDVKERLGL